MTGMGRQHSNCGRLIKSAIGRMKMGVSKQPVWLKTLETLHPPLEHAPQAWQGAQNLRKVPRPPKLEFPNVSPCDHKRMDHLMKPISLVERFEDDLTLAGIDRETAIKLGSTLSNVQENYQKLQERISTHQLVEDNTMTPSKLIEKLMLDERNIVETFHR